VGCGLCPCRGHSIARPATLQPTLRPRSTPARVRCSKASHVVGARACTCACAWCAFACARVWCAYASMCVLTQAVGELIAVRHHTHVHARAMSCGVCVRAYVCGRAPGLRGQRTHHAHLDLGREGCHACCCWCWAVWVGWCGLRRVLLLICRQLTPISSLRSTHGQRL